MLCAGTRPSLGTPMSRTDTLISPRTASPSRAVSRTPAGRSVLHVTTSVEGDVAAVVRSTVARDRDAGRNADWATVSSDGSFPLVSQHLTAALQGSDAAAAELGEPERLTYASVLRAGAGMLAQIFGRPNLVFLHDPATVGLCRAFKKAGATVVWVCHLRVEVPSEASAKAWEFLSPHLDAADHLIFLQPAAVPKRIEPERLIVPSSALNRSPVGDPAIKKPEIAATLAHLSPETRSS